MQQLLHFLGVQQGWEEMKCFTSNYHPNSLCSVFHHHDTGMQPLLLKHTENVSQSRKNKDAAKTQGSHFQKDPYISLVLCFFFLLEKIFRFR